MTSVRKIEANPGQNTFSEDSLPDVASWSLERQGEVGTTRTIVGENRKGEPEFAFLTEGLV